MFILFNKEGHEFLRYFMKELPDELKEYESINLKEIPIKEGYIERAKLINNKLVWEYKKIDGLIEI